MEPENLLLLAMTLCLCRSTLACPASIYLGHPPRHQAGEPAAIADGVLKLCDFGFAWPLERGGGGQAPGAQYSEYVVTRLVLAWQLCSTHA